MLTRLKITNFVLINELELDFNSGLTVLTGETGSGKSIIIDALMLIFGARVSTDIIRSGSAKTELVAEFTLSNHLAIDWLKKNDLIDIDDPTNLICRRVIDTSGKNKIYLNGNVVTSSQIRTLGEFILDIHTQHAAITILKSDTQRNLLDAYAEISDSVMQLNNYYKRMRELEKLLNESMLKATELELRKQTLTETISELVGLNLKVGEWEELEQEHKQLSNIGMVLEELDCVQSLLQNQDASILKTIHNMHSRLTKITPYVPKIDELLALLDGIEIDLTEFDRNVSAILNTLGADPKELANLEARIEQIFALGRKYKLQPNQIVENLATWQKELESLNHDSNVELLQSELIKVKDSYMVLADKISSKRSKFALELGDKVTSILHKLAINGEFHILVTPVIEPSSYGLENVEYQVCFNKGMPLQPLAKVASGGELSRTALALYLLLSINNSPDVIVFDEIDVGISGKVASHVGDMLYKLGANKQVICITHQPQTASFGQSHLVVSKKSSSEATLLNVEYVAADSRINEIARMLGGIKITNTTLSHAKEMLQQSGSEKSYHSQQ